MEVVLFGGISGLEIPLATFGVVALLGRQVLRSLQYREICSARLRAGLR